MLIFSKPLDARPIMPYNTQVINGPPNEHRTRNRSWYCY
jgi:hypothetical protein